jgi:hypothetical protein
MEKIVGVCGGALPIHIKLEPDTPNKVIVSFLAKRVKRSHCSSLIAEK